MNEGRRVQGHFARQCDRNKPMPPSKLAQDLEWMLLSPSLVSESCFPLVPDESLQELFARNRKWFADLEADTAGLRDRLENAARSYKLGIYAEALLEHALRSLPEIEVIVSHLPVYEGKIARGEFDFILKNSLSGKTEHWELAVKYFLLRERDLTKLPNVVPADFVGPNGRDSLGNKLKKMMDRQLCLGQTPEGATALAGLGLESVQPLLLSRGILFYDWRWPRPIARPSFAGPISNEGWWCTFSEVREMLGGTQARRFAWLRRPQWLAPFDASSASAMLFDQETLLDFLDDHFRASPGAVMLAEIAPGPDGVLRECGRGFVVHDQWPEPVDAHGA